jgi:hypothetical protein
MSISFRPGIPFRELRRGWEAVVLPGPELPPQHPVEKAAQESSQNQSTVVVTGSYFRVQADFRTAHEGNAYFAIDASTPLGDGKVRAGTRLCNGIACATLATAPVAWRWLLNRYLRYAAAAPENVRCESAGFMNLATPWVHLYTTHAQESLTAKERFSFDLLLHTLGLLAIRRAEGGSQAAIREGRVFKPDPIEFPELRSDS